MKKNGDEIYLEDFLENSVWNEAEAIEKMEVGSEEREAAVKDFNNRCKAWIDGRKAVLELDNNKEMKEKEFKLKQIELGIGLLTTLLSIGAPLLFYNKWMRQGFKFEETGTYTSSTFKNFFKTFGLI